MLIGYARVSTHEQNTTLQTDALKKAGCQKTFQDRVSGAGNERPGFKAALEYVRKGDTLLVWRLDRLGRSSKNLIEIIGGLEKRGIGFRSLQESNDEHQNHPSPCPRVCASWNRRQSSNLSHRFP